MDTSPQPTPLTSAPISRAGPATRPRTPDALSATGLVCRYGDFEAVGGIDLAARPGELLALLGTNGAGKTTTLETLEGYRRPDAGEVHVLGADPWRARRRLAARIGIVLQRSGLPDDLTPAETLTLWRSLTPDAAGHLDVDEALERVGLTHRADVRCGRLSGGERRRLDLALAISNRPELLFLDEPTTGMDPEARVITWEIIRDLRAAGTTVVLTTHYLEEAEALADRLVILHEGRVAAAGTLDEVLARRPARVEARLAHHAGRPPDLDGRLRLRPGGELDVTTHDLQADLTRLLTWAAAHDVALEGLHAREASLEEVFHEIAGDGAHQETAR